MALGSIDADTAITDVRGPDRIASTAGTATSAGQTAEGVHRARPDRCRRIASWLGPGQPGPALARGREFADRPGATGSPAATTTTAAAPTGDAPEETARRPHDAPADARAAEDGVERPAARARDTDERDRLCRALTRERWASFMDDAGRVVDFASVRQIIFRAGIADDELRREVWKFILGMYPFHSTVTERQIMRENVHAVRADVAAPCPAPSAVILVRHARNTMRCGSDGKRHCRPMRPTAAIATPPPAFWPT